MRGWTIVVLAGLMLAFPIGSSAKVTKASTWAGTWNTNYGAMTLTASGSGTYEFCDGKITGSVSGNKLTGTFTQRHPCGGALEPSGSLEFTLAADGKSWTGRWHYAGSVGSTAWRTDWFATSCASGPCLKNGGTATTKPETPPATIRRGLVTVPIRNKQFNPKRLDVRSGATLKICNNDPAFREPFSFPKTGPNAFRVRLKPGACLTHRLVNKGKAPITVKVFDEVASQMKLIIVIHPAK